MRNLPIVALILAMAGALVWMAWSLADLNWKYGHAWNDGGTQTAILIILALSLFCLGLAWVFWWLPWSEATVTLDTQGLTLCSTGLISFPETRLNWTDIGTIQYIGGLYRNNVIDVQYRSDQNGVHGNRRFATRAVGIKAKVIVQEIGRYANAAGFELEGPPVFGLLLLTAKWQVVTRRP